MERQSVCVCVCVCPVLHPTGQITSQPDYHLSVSEKETHWYTHTQKHRWAFCWHTHTHTHTHSRSLNDTDSSILLVPVFFYPSISACLNDHQSDRPSTAKTSCNATDTKNTTPTLKVPTITPHFKSRWTEVAKIMQDCKTNRQTASIEKLQLEMIKNILGVHRCTSSDACRAELGFYPLKIEIQKRCVQFWHHLHQSDPDSVQYKALLANETSKKSHPLNTLALQLVHKTQLLTDYSFNSRTIIKEIDKNLRHSWWATCSNTLSSACTRHFHTPLCVHNPSKDWL